VKGGVRYRYYANFGAVSNSEAGSNSSLPTVRIHAPAIERLMTDWLLMLPRSQSELASAFHVLTLSASQLREVIQKAQETADRWNTKSAADQRFVLQTVLVKVRLRANHDELCLSRRSLLQSIPGLIANQPYQTRGSTSDSSLNPEGDVVCIQTTSCLEHLGNGIRLIIKDASQAAPNMQLAPLLGKRPHSVKGI
jgi:hypothetical protein